MEIPVLIAAIVLISVFVGGIISVIVVSRKQAKKKANEPSRHRGDFRSQKGRVYKKGSTDHNAAPTSPS